MESAPSLESVPCLENTSFVENIPSLVRLATLQDLEAIVAIDALCFVAGIVFSRRELSALLKSRSTASLVAVRGQEVVGFAILGLLRSGEEVRGELITIDVLPAHRHAGVGNQLHSKLEDILANCGGTSLELHVSVENDAAICFYQRLGYRIMGRVPLYYLNSIDAWKMEKSLPRQ